MNIIYATDDNFVPFAGVSIFSLLYNNKNSKEINIYILDNNISEINKQLLRKTVESFGRSIDFFNVDKYMSKIKETGAREWSGSLSAYARLFIGEFFNETTTDRVLYLDCDTIVNGDITELFTLDMSGYACGAVCDYISSGIRLIDGLKLSDKYYNSGVMLIDINNWNSNHCQDRIINHMNNVQASYPYVDQDIINAVLHDDIYTLPIQYNVFPYYNYYGFDETCYIYDLNEENHYTKREYGAHLKDKEPVIIHYTKTFLGRPWEEGNNDELAVYWDKYYNLSLWKDIYKKEIFVSNPIAKSQYWFSRHLNKKLYLNISRLFARRYMKKLQEEYCNNKVAK
jgi:lipopolysaccharide biosynthesis glycosyltransferase